MIASLTLLDAVLLVVLAASAWTDLRSRRIPNALTVGGLVVALGIRATMGWAALGDGLIGTAVALLVIVPLFATGGFGGGDAKLLAAVGAFMGPGGFLIALLCTALAGGLLALAATIRRGVVLPALLNTRSLMTYVFSGGRRGERTTLDMPGVRSIPYALAIGAGTVIALWYGASM